jgi:hypothetical protein
MVFVTAGYSGKRFIFEKAKELGVRSVVLDGPDRCGRALHRSASAWWPGQVQPQDMLLVSCVSCVCGQRVGRPGCACGFWVCAVAARVARLLASTAMARCSCAARPPALRAVCPTFRQLASCVCSACPQPAGTAPRALSPQRPTACLPLLPAAGCGCSRRTASSRSFCPSVSSAQAVLQQARRVTHTAPSLADTYPAALPSCRLHGRGDRFRPLPGGERGGTH